MTINPYLNFNGTCEEAFNFYKSVFGGDFAHVSKFSEMPPNPEWPISDEDKNKIMHVSLPIGPNILMGSDTLSMMQDKMVQGTNFQVSINTETTEEADRVFNALSEGGHVTMPMNKTFWNAYFGSFTDKFGISWMVNCQL